MVDLPRFLLLAAVPAAILLASWPVQAHHQFVNDDRFVQPSGLPVFAHVPVAAGYETLPAPQPCLDGAAVPGTFYSESFEGTHGYTFIQTPLSGSAPILWSATSYAGVGSDTGHGGPKRLYWGSVAQQNYDVGHSAGTAQSPPITLPSSGHAILTFATKWQVEWLKGYDHLYIEAKLPDGKVHILCHANSMDRGDPTGVNGETLVPSCSPFHFNPCLGGSLGSSLVQWESRMVQLPAAWAGKTIQLRFTFDSADDKANIYNGWMVDDVKLATGVPA